MHWEERLLTLFEDLEQQAEGLHLTERDAELADRSVAEYSHVPLASRIHASTDRPVALHVLGVGTLRGRLGRAGPDWCLLRSGGDQEWLVRLAAVRRADGLSERAVAEEARPVTARLSFGAAVRRLVAAREPVVLHHVDGTQQRTLPLRVGADFVEVVDAEEGATASPSGMCAVVPFSTLAALRST